MDHTFVPPSQNSQPSSSARSSQRSFQRNTYSDWNQQQSWNGQTWDQHSTRSSSRSQSPWQRQAPRRKNKPKQPAQHKGEGKGQPQHKGAKGKGKGKTPDPAPWSSSTKPAVLPAPTTLATQSKAEAKLQEIVSVLKKKDDPELQTLAKEADVLHNKTATTKLHKAVTKHGDAKTSLLSARQARSNLHASWRQYLDSAIETWKNFIADFDAEDRRLEMEIDKANAELTVAQSALDDAKKAATEEELKSEVECIDDDDGPVDSSSKTSQAMRDGLTVMLDGLTTLQSKTEEMGEECSHKRQRVDDGKGLPSSMQPFGGAGR